MGPEDYLHVNLFVLLKRYKYLLHVNLSNMKNTGKNYSRDRYRQLSEWGSKLDLSFSSHVLLGNKIIALDGIKKVLLVLEQDNGQDRFYIIQLKQVKTITVKKEYSSIKAGE